MLESSIYSAKSRHVENPDDAELFEQYREAGMLRYLGRNAGNDVIAAEMQMYDVTVRKHIRSLLTKLSID